MQPKNSNLEYNKITLQQQSHTKMMTQKRLVCSEVSAKKGFFTCSTITVSGATALDIFTNWYDVKKFPVRTP